MILDINKDINSLLFRKLGTYSLSAGSLYSLLIYIFMNYRFSVKFMKKVINLIEDFHAKDVRFTPSLSGNEDKERILYDGEI